MPDSVGIAKRAQIMAAVRSVGNRSTELKAITVFRAYGIVGWRRNMPVFGKPDFVFRRARLAVFIDGCFWHGCAVHCRLPATNTAYWLQKIGRNIRRDREVNRELKRQGWSVIRFWEHEFIRQECIASKIEKALAKSAVKTGKIAQNP